MSKVTIMDIGSLLSKPPFKGFQYDVVGEYATVWHGKEPQAHIRMIGKLDDVHEQMLCFCAGYQAAVDSLIGADAKKEVLSRCTRVGNIELKETFRPKRGRKK